MSSELLQKLRKMILSGELSPGDRITETGLAEKLGVSRTPIRNALPALEAEGFLETVGKRGLVIKQFSMEDCVKALDLRGNLEAIAARKLAYSGASKEVLIKLQFCLLQGDQLFQKRYLTFEDEELYGQMNAEFHQIIADNCGDDLLRSFIMRLNTVPFAAPSAIVFDQIGLDRAFELLFRAHGQHHAITEAIQDKDGSRVEYIFREHANGQKESMFSRMPK